MPNSGTVAIAVLALGLNGLMDFTGPRAGWGAEGMPVYRLGTCTSVEREETAAMEVRIEEAQQELTPQVMSLPGVVGIAIGECEGKPCIKVLVASKTRELMGKIPPTFKGYKVTVDEVGDIRGPRPPQ